MQSFQGFARACAFAGVFVLASGLVACSKKPPQEARLGQGAQASQAAPGTPGEFSNVAGDRVFFATDSSELSAEARATLREQAKWLSQYPAYTVTIEGHADERGTREYNIALGARRAAAVREYLADLGVKNSRMRTVSYGKERPVATCNNISCWSQNRRAVTVLGQQPGS
jgi:peptidoglycan-associated lipoprotein